MSISSCPAPTMNLSLSLTALSLLSACGGGGEAAAAPAPPPAPAGWTRLADLPEGLAKFGAGAVGNSLIAAGGYDTRRSSFIYDIASNSWRSGPQLPRGSDNVAVVGAGGKVYAIGGEASNALQIYDPVANAWSSGPNLPGVRFASAAALFNDRLHVIGGWNYSNTSSASLATQSAFDLGSQSWLAMPLAELPSARNAAAAAVIDGKLCVAGGRSPGIRAADQQPLAAFDCYSAATNSWTTEASLPTARGSLAAAVLAGKLYTFGGETAARTVSDAVERYDPVTRSWQAQTAMPFAAHGLAAVTVGDAIYVMGGFTRTSDAVGSESRQLWRYQPQ